MPSVKDCTNWINNNFTPAERGLLSAQYDLYRSDYHSMINTPITSYGIEIGLRRQFHVVGITPEIPCLLMIGRYFAGDGDRYRSIYYGVLPERLSLPQIGTVASFIAAHRTTGLNTLDVNGYCFGEPGINNFLLGTPEYA